MTRPAAPTERKRSQEEDELECHLNHLGAIGLLCEVSAYISGPEADEFRLSIEQCLDDAIKVGLIQSWKRILNRFEVEP